MADSNVVQLGDMFQVGFAIRDADKVADIWTKTFGFHDWDTHYLEGIDGKGNPWKAKIVEANMGLMQYELIEPAVGRIAQSRMLEKYGEGIHHVKFSVPDVVSATNKLKERPGFRVIWQNERLSYIDVPGGVCIELVKPLPEPWKFSYPAGAPDIVNLGDLEHVAIAVNDADPVVKAWTDAFGLSGWQEKEYRGTDKDGSPWRNRIVSTHIGPMIFEFMQPKEGRRAQAVFLEKHGEGIHNLGFRVDDLERATDKLLATPGFELVIRNKDWMSYIQIPGGFVIELLKKR